MFSSFARGFLPSRTPLLSLPPSYTDIESLIQEVPDLIVKEGLGARVGALKLLDVSPLLLSPAIPSVFDLEKELIGSESCSEMDVLIHALYRDYAILSAAYLLGKSFFSLFPLLTRRIVSRN